ncbi:transporter [Mesorhizobium sp. NBSH29]|uniref:transporter n=1 Tax=Mesorhizobium sp. NBSH29 TaxID=2654249 RepID=UPI001896421B|nr:transporter [Mesorhizobium sp. NBSH29]QPC86591.1 transporter [Mesorhizobium sp. NBSH29]
MPTADQIETYLKGAWLLLKGKPEGLKQLDLSADGFWNSFFAIILALPPFVVGWAAVANDLSLRPDVSGGRFSIFLRLGFIDIATWALPLAMLALAARHVGLASRFVAYVVATNWSQVIIVWMMLPPVLLQLFLPDTKEIVTFATLTIFLISMVLSWRLTNAVLGKGPAVASGLFVAMLLAAFAVLLTLQALLGLTPSVHYAG